MRKKHGRCRRGIRPSVGSIGRPGVNQKEKLQRFWMAIATGVSSEDAAAIVGVSSAVGGRWFRHGGGMRNIRFTPRSVRFLSFPEREEIALLRAQGHGVREIARQLGRHPATISRELRRNAVTRSGYVDYRASTAQWHAERRASRPKQAKLMENNMLRQYVQDRLSGAITAPSGKRVGPNMII